MLLNEYIESLKKLNDINAIAEMRDILDPLSQEWHATEDRLRELLKAKYKDEDILVVKAETVKELIESEQVYSYVSDLFIELLKEKAFFMPRYMMEFNPSYKQLIPYIVAIKGNRVFTMTRLKGDSRLVGNISVGIGGHINPVDEDSSDIIMAGLRRELEEEVEVHGISNLTFRGCIYDPSNKVGQDHVGLVYTCEPWDECIEVKEKDNLSGEMCSIEYLKENQPVMETWTRIVYENILK